MRQNEDGHHVYERMADSRRMEGGQKGRGCRPVCAPDPVQTPAHQLVTCYMRVARLHRNILDQQLKRTGVYRSQHQILVTLDRNPNASQRDIALWLGVSTATIAVSLKKLEKGGYIKRIVDADDNRFNQIQLTERGQDMVEHSWQFFHNVENQMFCDFNAEEFDTLERLLDRAYKNLLEIVPDADMTEREE